MLYVCKVVGLSVDEDLIQKDIDGLGVYHMKPLYEVNISNTNQNNQRLDYIELDYQSISTPGDDFGCFGDWVGTFSKFIESEYIRKKISLEEKERIFELAKHFKQDRGNKKLKKELTDLIKKAIKV